MTIRRLILTLAASVTLVSCSDDTVTAPTPPTPPVASFFNRLPVGGAVSRRFTTSEAGVIRVTLRSTNPAGTLVGVGIGVPLTGIADCGLTVSVTTTGSTEPQLAVSAEAGTYCVLVYDPGSLTAPIDFDATILYPWSPPAGS